MKKTVVKKNRKGYKTCTNCGMLNVPSADVQPVVDTENMATVSDEFICKKKDIDGYVTKDS